MSTRAAAVEVTRERILDAACDAFLTSWYEDVTLRDVAAAADVALQTIVNHFGTKEALYGAAVERIDDVIQAGRYDVEPGDVEGAVAALIDDYDRTGDFILRALAKEGRLAVVRRAWHAADAPTKTGSSTFSPPRSPACAAPSDSAAWPSSSPSPTSTPGSCSAWIGR